jgi:hypothetical protein
MGENAGVCRWMPDSKAAEVEIEQGIIRAFALGPSVTYFFHFGGPFKAWGCFGTFRLKHI